MYVDPSPPKRHARGETFAFGPFDRDVLATTCEVLIPDWKAHLNYGPIGTIEFRVTSEESGEPIEGLRVRKVGDKGSHFIANSRNGNVSIRAQSDSITCKLTHRLFRDLHMGTIDVVRESTVDLGQVSMQPLRQIRCQLLDVRGEPLRDRRSIWFEDPELGGRRALCERDGSFVIAVASEAPSVLRIGGPSGVGSQVSMVPLIPAGPSFGHPEGSPYSWVCTVPDWIEIQLQVTGLALDLRGTRTSLLAEDSHGKDHRISQYAIRGEVAMYAGLLPPGRYVLKSGPLVAVPRMAFDVEPEAFGEGLRLETRGAPVYE